MLEYLLLKCYSILSVGFYPLGKLWIRMRTTTGKEDPTRLSERFGYASLPRPSGEVVWVHGASVGEAMSALGMMEDLLKRHPNLSIVLTTGTIASARLLKKRLEEPSASPALSRIVHQMAPFDWPWCVSRFLKFWTPSHLLVLEGDFWPHMLTLTARRNILIFLVNAQISERSLRRWRWFRPLLRSCLQKASRCLTTSESQAKRFRALGVPNVTVTGSLKWATPPLPIDPTLLKSYRKAFGSRPLWLAVSTHPGEEQILCEAHRKLLEEIPSLLLVLAPRHPKRTSEVIALLQKEQLSCVCKSAFTGKLQKEQVCLVDEMGALSPLYALAQISLVGGSLLPDIGGHTLIEPATFQSAVLHGPFMEKQQDIATTFHEEKACTQVENAQDIASKVRWLLEDSFCREDMTARALRMVERRRTEVSHNYESLLETL